MGVRARTLGRGPRRRDEAGVGGAGAGGRRAAVDPGHRPCREPPARRSDGHGAGRRGARRRQRRVGRAPPVAAPGCAPRRAGDRRRHRGRERQRAAAAAPRRAAGPDHRDDPGAGRRGRRQERRHRGQERRRIRPRPAADRVVRLSRGHSDRHLQAGPGGRGVAHRARDALRGRCGRPGRGRIVRPGGGSDRGGARVAAGGDARTLRVDRGGGRAAGGGGGGAGARRRRRRGGAGGCGRGRGMAPSRGPRVRRRGDHRQARGPAWRPPGHPGVARRGRTPPVARLRDRRPRRAGGAVSPSGGRRGRAGVPRARAARPHRPRPRQRRRPAGRRGTAQPRGRVGTDR